jgi:acyl CoA:acetate/3-ketoacid CoA transferase
VPDVQQITFNGAYALARGQTVTYVTDRAVFRLTPGGLELCEMAAGVDVGRDVLGQIGFPVRVAEPLRPMDARLFRAAPMGLAPEFRARGARRDRR